MEDNFALVQEKWPEILEKIRTDYDVSRASYETWLTTLTIKSVDNDRITFVVPSGTLGINTLNKKYADAIRVSIEEVTGLPLDVRFVTPDQSEPAPVIEPAFTEAMERARLNPRYTFDSFVVGNNNQFAHAASLAVAETPGEIYNPLYLYAESGLGKTHLMHSIAHFILRSSPEKRVLYVTSEDFTNELIDSIRNGNSSAMSRFRDKYRNIDVLLIDDIQFIIGKESTQEEFFHTFEALTGAKKQIVVASDKPPKDLDILEERIRSRLEMGLIADISAPDYDTRMAILRKKVETDGYAIDDKVLDYIAKNMKSNIRELEGCLNQIRFKSKLEKRTIDLELAEDILQNMISPEEQKAITSENIIAAVAEHFHLSLQDIKSSKRDSKYVYPRKIAMFLCRDMTSDSMLTIANLLNKKDHTTVINAVTRIDKELQTSEETRMHVETIRKKISPGT